MRRDRRIGQKSLREWITVGDYLTVNPDKASSYLALVPGGESKEDIIRRINEVREFNSGDTKQRLSHSIRLKLGNCFSQPRPRPKPGAPCDRISKA